MSKKCKARALTDEQTAFLVSETTLRKWLPFSLETRTKLFEQHYPGTKLAVTRLRLLYKKHRIRHRIIASNLMLSQTQHDKINREKRLVLPRMISMIEQNKNLIFVDEAVFSSRLDHSKSWWVPGNRAILIDRNSLGFKAVGVVAGIDMQGRVVAVHMEDTSID